MFLPILHLANLKHLHIDDCRNLEKRCVEGSGAEWFQISHILNIKINGKYIKGKDSEDSGDFDDYDKSEYVEFDDSEDDRDDYTESVDACKKIPFGKMIKLMITDAKNKNCYYLSAMMEVLPFCGKLDGSILEWLLKPDVLFLTGRFARDMESARVEFWSTSYYCIVVTIMF
ncbi:hypothetical protein CFP56_034253 [Quercus suber]|uniref:Uncharacterized protein n=1 Tax=Quercus suber TaxID=58331 RepID=A0AAW0JD36_QUESU